MTTHHRTRRALAIVRVAAGLVVASSLLGTGVGSADAQSTPTSTLGGFTGSAGSSALHVEYNPEGLLPTGSPVDLNSPDALVTIASGPSTFARAGIADPGDLLANPDALLAAASSDYPAGAIPPWPFRITAGSGVGEPVAESAPAPGLNARVTAVGGTATAEATGPGTSVPAVVSVGSVASFADTTTDGSSVTVHARSEISEISILGIVEIGSITTDLTATSTGSGTTVTGGTVVTGVTVAGQPAEIDDEGIRATGLDLGAVLEPLGIVVTLPGPSEAEGPTAGYLASNGLRIEVRASTTTLPVVGDVIGDLLGQLPPIDPIVPGLPSPEDVIAAARANNVATIELGRGVVSLTARTPSPRSTPPAATPTPASGGSAPGPAATPARPAATAPVARPAAAPAATPVAAAPVATAAVPALSVGAGVGALAVLLLLAQPFLGDRLARLAAAQLATTQESCPWERR
jgi:hypothetical protein